MIHLALFLWVHQLDTGKDEVCNWSKVGSQAIQLPVLLYPRERTSPDHLGMSQRCQQRKCGRVHLVDPRKLNR